jgi:ribosomal protein S18 acetylase RimI-like enzyme
MDRDISLRPVTPKDEAFLYSVYAGTREQELAQTGWNDEQREAFLRMQFDAQHQDYTRRFSSAEFQIILSNEVPIGRLYLDRRDDEIRIVDIALLASHRNGGVGSTLLRSILAEGRESGLPVRVHVERLNPALRLYGRLGFRQISEDGVYLLMERTPTHDPTRSSAAPKPGSSDNAG